VLSHRFAWPILALALMLAARVAWADVTVPTPNGWSADANASRAALDEAEDWASATGLEVRQVASPKEADDFVENLVVLLDRRPLRPDVLGRDDLALATLAELGGAIFDTSAAPTSQTSFEIGGTTGVRARWEVDGVTWDLVLVPSGSEHALIVLKTATADESLHGDLIEDVAAGIDGASAPISPFPLATWRWALLPVWLLIAAVSHGMALRRGDHAGDQLSASRKSSMIVIVLAVVLTGVTYVALSGMDVELQLVGTNATRVALETLGAGMLAAAALFVLGRMGGAGPGRVESAPRTGVFSAEVPATPAPMAATPGDKPRTEKSPVPRQLGPDADADVGAFHRGSND
jgi:hypothetical protein